MDEISIDLPVTPGVDLLQRVPLFRTLGFTETMSLSGICAIESKRDGEMIIQQDSLGMALYILKEGEAVVRRRDPITGVEKELATLKGGGRGRGARRGGGLFGEVTSRSDPLASAGVVARAAVERLVTPRREFEAS